MILVNKNYKTGPSLLEGLLSENRLDVTNCEKFSTALVNISEKKTNFAIEIIIPGISKNDVAIEVEENVLKVSSNISDEVPAEDTIKFLRKDFDFKNFEKKFTLPNNIDTENIHATHKDGILYISIPKKMEEKAVKKMVEIS
jgi:HSP20 family protein